MSSTIPIQPTLKSANYDDELSSFTDLNNILKNFMTKKLRSSLSSPPLAKDVGELEIVIDKTLRRVYTKIDGILRYVSLT